MATPNITLNDEEIALVSDLIRAYRSAYIYDDSNGPNTTHAQLKRLERKMDKAFEHPQTEFL